MNGIILTLLGAVLLIGAMYFVYQTTQIQLGPYTSRVVTWLLTLLVFLGVVSMPIPGISSLSNRLISIIVILVVFLLPLGFYIYKIVKTWPAEWDAIKRHAPNLVWAMFLAGLARFLLSR